MFICTCCMSDTKKTLINLGNQPYANKYPSSETKLNEPINNLSIEICTKCYTASTKNIASRKIMFEEYFYLSSINSELVKHFKNLAKIIPPTSKLLDIGSNDGIFLKPLQEKNVNALGIDPSENVGKIANENGLKTIIGFFDDKNTSEILNNYGKFDYIIASSIFTHVEKSDEFINNVFNLLNDNGTFILEIEYIKNILSNIEFERFYFDRPYYFSIKGVMNIFEKNKLFVNKIENISPHGGSLRFFISKEKFNLSQDLQYFLNEEDKFFKNFFKNDYQKIAQHEATRLKNFLIKLKEQGDKVIGFGCPARFSTITNFINIDKSLLPFVIDDSPIKQNKLSPGKHIPIVPREFLENYNPDVIIVFAYEYFNSIYSYTKKFKADHYKPIPLSQMNY